MFITGLTECELFFWSPEGSELVKVPRDEDFLADLIPKLEYFYFNFLLPKISQP